MPATRHASVNNNKGAIIMTLQQLGNKQVNAVFKLSDMPKYFKDFIDARLASANRD